MEKYQSEQQRYDRIIVEMNRRLKEEAIKVKSLEVKIVSLMSQLEEAKDRIMYLEFQTKKNSGAGLAGRVQMTQTMANHQSMHDTHTTLQGMVIKKLQSSSQILSDDKKKFRRLTRSIDFPKTMPTEEDSASTQQQYYERRNLGNSVQI